MVTSPSGGLARYILLYFMPALREAIEELPTAARPTRLGMMGEPDTELMAQFGEELSRRMAGLAAGDLTVAASKSENA